MWKRNYAERLRLMALDDADLKRREEQRAYYSKLLLEPERWGLVGETEDSIMEAIERLDSDDY